MAIPLKYNGRSLIVRRFSNAMTGGGIALVVTVFVIVMAVVTGLERAIRDTSSPNTVIVLRRGSTTETGSSLTLDQYDALKFLSGIQRSSPEVAEQILMPSPGGSLDDLALRGLLPDGLPVHNRLRVIAGRMFQPGLSEIIIGRGLVGRYPGFTLGSHVHLGRRDWAIVGVFADDGSSFESEVWGDAHSFQQDANRGAVYQSVRLDLAPGADEAALIKR